MSLLISGKTSGGVETPLLVDSTGVLQTAGGGSGSDASAANQQTQITAEQAILAKLIAAPATEAKQDTQITDLGGVTETAPATDTASSGLNGRLQRIAQRLTSLIALLPAALTSAGSLKVAMQESAVGKSAQVVITRSADTTQYAVGDAVGAASAIYETAVLGTANGEFIITRADLHLQVATLPTGMTAGFTLMLFNASPTAIADNAVVGTTLTTGDLTKLQGRIDIGTPIDEGNYCSSPDNGGLNAQVKLSATGTLFVILKTLSAFTPTSSAVKEIHLHGVGA